MSRHRLSIERTRVTALQLLTDPWLDATMKGFPHTSPPLRRSAVAQQGWCVLAGDLPLPVATVKRDALAHNIAWMRRYVDGLGIELAPHGKTTMSPQIFRQQLDAGAWGLTFATVAQLRVGVAAGARRCIVANQVADAIDLHAIASLKSANAGLQVLFLIDSLPQLDIIEAWHAGHADAPPFDVLIEIGIEGGRTGCRTADQAAALSQRAHASAAVRLCGVECYEGLGVDGTTGHDRPHADSLMKRVTELALQADRADWFDADEVIVSAGGSAIFDLVATHMKPRLSRPVRGLLRSGCYVTHDDGFYRRMVAAVGSRLRCDDTLHAAIEVWAGVQSVPEPGLAILAVGKRDLSHDLDLPIPVRHAPRGAADATAAPADWRITGLNDQHAYLRWDDAGSTPLRVGDRVGLGISHPCTTFDKWRWLPVVDPQLRVVDALVTCF
jgi:D-serine dehydratase